MTISPDPLPGIDTEALAECHEMAGRAIRRHDLEAFDAWLRQSETELRKVRESMPRHARPRLRLVRP